MKNYLNKILISFFVVLSLGISQDSYSLRFDGEDDDVQFGNGLSIDNNELTILAWINFSEGGTNYPRVISNGESGYELITTGTGSTRRILFHFNAPSGASGWVDGQLEIIENTWYHVAVVYGGGQAMIYIDGLLDVINESPSSLGNTSSGPIFGQRGDGCCRYKGLLDDVKIWNVALTQEQIQDNMTSELSGNESGLAGYWNFNEGGGSTLTDLSGNGNNGTINGATWSEDV